MNLSHVFGAVFFFKVHVPCGQHRRDAARRQQGIQPDPGQASELPLHSDAGHLIYLLACLRSDGQLVCAVQIDQISRKIVFPE